MEALAGWIVGDHRDRTAPQQEVTQVICIIGGIPRTEPGRRQGFEQGLRQPDIAALAGRHLDRDEAPEPVADRVDFCRPSAARAADRLRVRPPFPPAAER